MDTIAFYGKEKISKILLKLAPPVMLAQLIQALYNIIDSLFIGRFSDDGLTALSIVYPLQLLMIDQYIDCISLRADVIYVNGFIIRQLHLLHPRHRLIKLRNFLIEDKIPQNIGAAAVRQNIDRSLF